MTKILNRIIEDFFSGFEIVEEEKPVKKTIVVTETVYTIKKAKKKTVNAGASGLSIPTGDGGNDKKAKKNKVNKVEDSPEKTVEKLNKYSLSGNYDQPKHTDVNYCDNVDNFRVNTLYIQESEIITPR